MKWRLLPEDYDQIKQMLSMRAVAETYGYRANSKNMIICPFHKDKNPSCQLYKGDKGFFCFSCNKGGDVITFTASLYGLKNSQAALKLIDDFNLPIKTNSDSFGEKMARERKAEKRNEVNAVEKARIDFLNKYYQLCCEIARDQDNEHYYDALVDRELSAGWLEDLREGRSDLNGEDFIRLSNRYTSWL